MKYYKLNSTFKHEGKTLKVVKAIAGCRGCHFYDNTCKIKFAYPCLCAPTCRKDENNIIYQEVKKVSLLRHLKNLLKGK